MWNQVQIVYQKAVTVILHKQRTLHHFSYIYICAFFLFIKDEKSGRRSILSDRSEQLDLQLNSMNMDSDVNESMSSRSNQGETTENTNLDTNHQITSLRSTSATPAILAANTSRTSISTNIGPSAGPAISGRLTSIMERRRSPDILLKQWMKNKKLLSQKSNDPLPLTVGYQPFDF